VYPVTVRVTDDGAPALDDFETIQITVGEVNQAPTAVNDTYVTDEDTPLVVSAPGLLLNDSDPDLPPNALSAVLDTPPALGELALATDGSFVYTPTLDFNGLVTFTYHANDGLISSNLALVSITVDPVNDAPVAEGQVFTTAEDTAYSGALAGSDVDGDPLTFSLDTAPAHGSMVIAANGDFTYTPTLNSNGPDSFTFAVADGSLFDLGQVDITVEPVNDAPLPDAGTDQAGNEGQAIQFNGSYSDPGLLNIQAVTIAWDFGDGATASGTLTPTHTYTDDGVYIVTLVVTDDLGGVGMDSLLVTVDNVAPALAPIADQSVVAGEALTLTAAYADPGLLDTHTAVIAWGDGLTGTLNLAAGLSSFDFAHAYAAAGTYTVTVTLTDDDGGQDVATFTVEVTPAGFTTFLPVVRNNRFPASPRHGRSRRKPLSSSKGEEREELIKILRALRSSMIQVFLRVLCVLSG
jgi:VCBS repeat-containing protein